MNRLATATLPACLVLLVAAACGDHDRGYGGAYVVVDCAVYTSCGSCTPIEGCGWCFGSDGSGTCSGSSETCNAASWTWDPSGCITIAQPTVGGDASSPLSDAGADAALPACTWDPGLYGADGSSNLCFAARTLTVCTGVDGCTLECLTNDPSTCPQSSSSSCSSSSGDAGAVKCADTCQPGEYAVECDNSGLGGSGPPGQPPAACHLNHSAVESAEAQYYCCPCGS